VSRLFIKIIGRRREGCLHSVEYTGKECIAASGTREKEHMVL